MSDIVGPANARAVLDALLPSVKAAVEGAQGESADERRTVTAAAQRRLREFADSTRAANLADPQEVAAVRQIDQIARELHSNITADQIGTSVAEIERSSLALEALAKQLGLQTTANRTAAKSISLEPVKKAVDQMTALVEEVKVLKAGLSSAKADEASVLQLIDQFAGKFEALQRALKPNG